MKKIEDTKKRIEETIRRNYSLKSYTADEIAAALVEGKTVYFVDTLNSGEDDLVIMDENEGIDDVKKTFKDYLDLDGFPPGWSVEEITTKTLGE